jgi:hypothetical protein
MKGFAAIVAANRHQREHSVLVAQSNHQLCTARICPLLFLKVVGTLTLENSCVSSLKGMRRFHNCVGM